MTAPFVPYRWEPNFYDRFTGAMRQFADSVPNAYIMER